MTKELQIDFRVRFQNKLGGQFVDGESAIFVIEVFILKDTCRFHHKPVIIVK